MESFITKIITEKLSTYAAIISMFTYTILLNRDLTCTCKPQVLTCDLYMWLPPFIILFLMLVADSSFQSICRYYSSHCKCLNGLCCFYVNHFLRALLVGSLWVDFLYLDGDWYVCCQNDRSEQQAKLACKAEKNITLNDTVRITELKNTSRAIGGWILFVVAFVTFVLTCVGACSDKRFLYDKLIIIEEGKVLKELLRNSAKEKLTEGIKKDILDKDWEGCFGVAGKLLDRPKPKAQNPSRRSSWP